MTHLLIDLCRALAGSLAGAVIGAGFEAVQDAARKRYARLQQSGGLKSEWWSVMRGSGQRIALLILALVALQVACPLLFRAGARWWVSAGVVSGYGWRLFCQFRQRQANRI